MKEIRIKIYGWSDLKNENDNIITSDGKRWNSETYEEIK